MANSRLLFAVVLGLIMPGGAFADYAYITNQSSSDLSVIDLDRMVESERIPTPGQPAGIAVAPQLGAVFIVSPESKMLRRYGMPAGAPEAERTLDGGPIGVAVDERRGRVFVSDWYNARVWVIAADGLATLVVLFTGSAPAGLAVSVDGHWLATADRDANQVSIFDAETLTLRHRVTVGSRPFGVTFSPDGRLFSADVGSNTVTAVDPVSGRVLGHVATRERPYAVAFASGRGFVTNQYDDSVSVFDAHSLAAVAVIDTGEYPEGIDTSADGRRIVVANWFSNSLTVIDSESLEIIGEIATGDGPRAFGRFLSAAPAPRSR
ncbi:beta-propeller fold lactonase family protein [Sinorhizobium numidicum]|uniref:Beta-propeller fold lactonase family protein n=1 Tax=Sinorhizobium numidicum TaxID=680248 RepID=A0ABY8CN20_9HYPH|nr:cytochrome D1 domain-containing protein [Sinorhizobium numidicum]WEX74069.1 beta-propeller fold lactonase family protein [Sinorhizobium numidicum]WEX80054.1 beta-propeller fold lactonase family protein [Sinorhizobium numidicum]